MFLCTFVAGREALSRSIVLAAVLLGATESVAAAAISEHHTAKPAIELILQPLVKGGMYRALQVTLKFAGSADGTTYLSLPDEWAGEKGLYRYLHNITVNGAALREGSTAAQRVLKHKPNAPIVVKYSVRPVANEVRREKSGNDYRPVIAGSYFHVLGDTFIISPSSVDGRARARFKMLGLLARHSFASDLEHQHAARELTMDDLLESVLVGGDFRVLHAGQGARLAIRGEWPRDDNAWLSSLSRIAQGTRGYWGDRTEPYLVTVLPITRPPGVVSIGGTGRSDGFALFATTNANPATTDQVLAHEMMHTWIPARIGGLPRENEELSYWLSEGFTDWASWRALVRSGMWQPVDLINAFNEVLSKYDSSAARNLANTDISARFWQDKNVQKLPYQRGLLLAMRWDFKVRKATNGQHGFDEVLRRMRGFAANAGSENAVGLLIRAVLEIAHLDISPDIERYVEAGESVPLEADILAPCGTVQERTLPTFHRGFEVQSVAAGDDVIVGVTPDSNAYRAGLRNGMKLVKRESGEVGNSLTEIRYSVLDGGTPRSFAWIPAGHGTEVRRKMVLEAAAMSNGASACTSRLGG